MIHPEVHAIGVRPYAETAESPRVEGITVPFLAQDFRDTPRPDAIPFTLHKGERIVMVGDSITEASRYSRMVETYLTVCTPELDVTVRNIGKGGEKAIQFLARCETDCLVHNPTLATVFFGMNDSGYLNDNWMAAETYGEASAAIINKLKSAGVRVLLGSPGCIGKLPPWPFISECQCTRDGINNSLLAIRNKAAHIAISERMSFADHFWNLYSARIISEHRFGSDYSVCGADDGVHNSWSGHVVIAYGFLKAMGLDGGRAAFTINLSDHTATADAGHSFEGARGSTYTFTSSRYPYCATGSVNKDWSIRSGMSLIPFNQDLNRWTLNVTGAKSPRYRIAWMNRQSMLEEWHIYDAATLKRGINLADEFHVNPFSPNFNRIDDLIYRKQSAESVITWSGINSSPEEAHRMRADSENMIASLRRDIREAFTPVTHNILVEPVP
jgi:lysophospholipase L1-like esterase